MKNTWHKKCLIMAIYIFGGIVLSIIAFFLLSKLQNIGGWLGALYDVFETVVWGFVFAYLMNPLLKLFESKVFVFKVDSRKKFVWKRALSMVLTYVVFLGGIAAFFLVIIPEIITSMYAFDGVIDKFQNYWQQFNDWLSEVLSSDNSWVSQFKTIIQNEMSELSSSVLDKLSVAQTAEKFALGAYHALYVFFIGMVVSVYMLASKETLIAQMKKTLFAIFRKKRVDAILRFMRRTHETVGNYLAGKLLDAAAVGLITFVVLTVFDFHYTALIALVVGVSNIIPFFGPFIGAIPSAILLLLIDPMEALWFIVIILIIQQLDGNVIEPAILGKSVGISSFWVVVSILIAGGLFGVIGLVLGVPLFTVFYEILRQFVDMRLEAKELPVNSEDYAGYSHDAPAAEQEKFAIAHTPHPKGHWLSRVIHGIAKDGETEDKREGAVNAPPEEESQDEE